MTITNANFDDGSIEKQIVKMIAIRDELNAVSVNNLSDAAIFTVDSRESMLEKLLLSASCQLKMKMCVLFVK